MPGMDLLETGPYKLLSMRRTDQRAESGLIRRCDVWTAACMAGGGGKRLLFMHAVDIIILLFSIVESGKS